MNRVLQQYQKTVVPALREKFNYPNIMSVPRIRKVVLNVGVGKHLKDSKMLENIERDLAIITGQKAVATHARKSIAGFKIRQGMKIGYKVTLRGKRMYDFIDRLISVALPRTRDFRGLPIRAFDQRGVLNLGITEHSIFPEIQYESLKDIFGLQIAVVTDARRREEAIELLKLLGFPLAV